LEGVIPPFVYFELAMIEVGEHSVASVEFYANERIAEDLS